LPRTQNGARNDILDRRDACPTWLAELGLPRRYTPRNDKRGILKYYFKIV